MPHIQSERGATIGRYRPLGVAGRGGMGEVLRAVDEGGRPVAVKLLAATSAGAAERFEREAQVLASLDHPHVVSYVDRGVLDDGRIFIAMEWVEGVDLAARLESPPPLGVAATIILGRRVAEALGAAHRRGVVHRDVKPRNIRLRNGDPSQPVLLDFGVARLGDGLTLTGHVVGTPRYMAPEQLVGERGVTPRADVYALGVVLFECLAGAHPFDLGRGAVAGDEPPRLRDLVPEAPVALDGLVGRMLARDPADRPADGRVVAAMLGAICADPERAAERPAITAGEQRLTCAVAVRVVGSGATETMDTGDSPLTSLLREAGTIALAQGETLVGVLPPAADVGAVAARGADLALRVLGELPGAGIGIATGWCQVTASAASGDLPALAATRAKGSPVGSVLLDDETALLLDGRFALAPAPEGHVLGPRRAAPAPRSLLGRHMPFVGRAAELALLEGAWQECLEEDAPTLVLVAGEPGAGKSRLVESFVGSLERRPQPPWVGWGSAGGAGPHALLRRLVTAAPGPEAAALLGILDVTRRPGADPGETLRALRDAWLRWLRALSRPAVLVLDDLHEAGPASLALVRDALEGDERGTGDPVMGAVLVLALSRMRAGEGSPLDTLRPCARSQVTVGRLSPRAARALVHATASEGVDDDLVADLVAASGGNPLLLEELVRARELGATLPPSVGAAAQARLAALEPASRRVLRAASALDEPFGASDVAAVAGDESTTWLAALVEAEALTLHGESYRFRHRVLRDAAHRALTPGDRRLAHAIVAERLAAAGAEPARRAPHLELAGKADLAATAWLDAAERAFAAADLDGCMTAACRARAAPDATTRGRALASEARAARWMGRLSDTRHAAEQAVALLPEGHAAWYDAVADLVDCLAELGAPERAATWLDALARVARAAPANALPAAAAIALCRSVVGLVLGGSYGLADGILAQIAHRGGIEGDAGLLAARHARALGFRLAAGTRFAAASRQFEDAAASFAKVGFSQSAAVERANAAWCLMECGDVEAALSRLRALSGTDPRSAPTPAWYARLHLGRALTVAGDPRAGAALLQEVLDYNRTTGNVLEREGARVFLSEALLCAGHAEEALARAQTAVEALTMAPALQAMGRGALLDALVVMGRPVAVVAGAAAAQLTALGSIPFLDATLRRALALAGHGADPLGEALAQLEARSQELSPGERPRFLRCAPSVAATLALAAERGVVLPELLQADDGARLTPGA